RRNQLWPFQPASSERIALLALGTCHSTVTIFNSTELIWCWHPVALISGGRVNCVGSSRGRRVPPCLWLYFNQLKRRKHPMSTSSLIFAGLWVAVFQTNSQVNVTQEHNNLSRNALYIDSAFTASAAANLARDLNFNGTISGNVYAQPLYVEGGPDGGAKVIVATESNPTATSTPRASPTATPRAPIVWQSDGSPENIQSIHDTQAQDGDTIMLPAGTFSWTQIVIITKGITVQGQSMTYQTGYVWFN